MDKLRDNLVMNELVVTDEQFNYLVMRLYRFHKSMQKLPFREVFNILWKEKSSKIVIQEVD